MSDEQRSLKKEDSVSSTTIFFRRLRHQITSTKVRNPVVWWRHRGLAPADVMLGSYPRSGSTWLRFTLFEILSGEPSSFDKVNAALRGISDYQHGAGLLPDNGRFIGTHEPYRPAYRRAVYLVRDVRDVVLSEYAFEKNLGIARDSMDLYLEDLLLGHKRHGSWQHHVESWIDSPLAASGNLLFIRYEDLRKDSINVFRQMVDFLRVKVSVETIERAVANNTVQRMREKEDSLYKQDGYAAVPRRPKKGVEAGGRFVRSGSIGGWQGRLSPQQLKLVERHAGSTLVRLGYPLMAEAEAELVPTV
jgi:Sulfotransferase domain